MWQEISGGLDLIKVGNYETSSRSYVGRFNFKGAQQQQFIGDLSGGERNRVHLAKVFKAGGNVLLLDEPTNDLDIETLRALEDALVAFPGCAVVISHDRWFLDRIATHIWPSRAIRKWSGSRATTRNMSRTTSGAKAKMPRSRTESATNPDRLKS